MTTDTLSIVFTALAIVGLISSVVVILAIALIITVIHGLKEADKEIDQRLTND